MNAPMVAVVVFAFAVLMCLLAGSLLLRRFSDLPNAAEGRIAIFWRHVIGLCLVVLGALGPLALRADGPGRGFAAFGAGVCLMVAWAIWHREAVRWLCLPAAAILFGSEFLRP
jgi:hypothetical protein